MLHVNYQITIEDRELTELFIGASGPGGQNVNKIATAFDRPKRRILTKPPPRRQDQRGQVRALRGRVRDEE